ncbi:MAG TPA: hypothetical protein VF691_19025 [Cytophagaceae bacterium]|jgi:p-aminobenzoyl-glutamate transporter AbgT
MSEHHSAEFYKALCYSTTEFDKSIVFIASGALGLSMAFIDKVVKLDTAHYKVLLILAWYFFGMAICLSLITHFISILANRWAIPNCPAGDNCDDVKEEKYRKGERIWNRSIRGLNISMIVTLLVGITLFLIFIQKNLLP